MDHINDTEHKARRYYGRAERNRITKYKSDDAVKIILGVVSMWSILELKGILITELDMADLKRWFFFNCTSKGSDAYLVTMKDYAYEPNGFVKFLLWSEKLYFWIVRIIILCISAAAPIWMIICY